MGLTGYSLTRANKREKDAERSDEEMRLKSAKPSTNYWSGSFAKNSPQSGQTYDLRFSWSLSVCMLSVPLFTMKHVHKPRAI